MKMGQRDRIQDMLFDFMMRNGMKSGDRLPPEEELAEEFNVSRVSLREALTGLKFMGMLESSTKAGTRIAGVDFKRLSSFLNFQLTFSEIPVYDLYTARLTIELGAIEAVCGRLKNSDYKKLCILAEGCVKKDNSKVELKRIIQSDMNFHNAILMASGNLVLQAFASLLEKFFRYIEGCNLKDTDSMRILEDHLTLVESLKNNELDLARSVLRQHLKRYSLKHNISGI